MPEKDNVFVWFWKQAFGSDELTAYNAEYTWESNQMAHAMMGFAIAAVWLRLAIGRWARYREGIETDGGAAKPARPTIFHWAWHSLDVSTFVLFGLIPLKELADILNDRTAFTDSPVPPNQWPLIFDSITDITFWWTGMFLAAVVVGGWWTSVKTGRFARALSRREKFIRTAIPIVGLLICVAFWYFYAATQWLNQKRTFDQSDMPFNYTRLAALAGQKPEAKYFAAASKVKWAELKTFRIEVADANEKPPQRHYVIIGGKPKDRSQLAVSMGSEYAFKLRPHDPAKTKFEFARVKYASAPAALEYPERFTDETIQDVLECVVIDDIDSFMRLAETTPAGSAAALEKLKFPQKLPQAKLDPKLASKLKLPETYPQMSEVERGKFREASPTDDPESEQPSFRPGKFLGLGEIINKNAISTIWVLSGDRSSDPPRWKENKKYWIEQIAGFIADGDVSKLQIIELADSAPPTEAAK